MLEPLGLDAAAEAVYTAMLANSEMGVTALAAHLGLDESQVRDALNRLSELALLRPSRESPGQLRPVSPAAGLDALVRRQQAELLRRHEEIAASQASIKRMISEYAGGKVPSAHADVVRLIGLDRVQARLEDLSRRSTSECLSVMPGGGQQAANLDASRSLDEQALRRGVSMRTIYQDSVRNDPATVAYAEWMAELGGEIRTAPLVPPRMIVVDRSTALVPLEPDDTSQGALQIEAPGMVMALVTLFEQAWHRATPLADGPHPHPVTGLTPIERALLKLLAQGHTDEVAAKRLGVSLRTVRRMMASIMDRLGATSRFQAGLKVGQRGWLPDQMLGIFGALRMQFVLLRVVVTVMASNTRFGADISVRTRLPEPGTRPVEGAARRRPGRCPPEPHEQPSQGERRGERQVRQQVG